MNEFFSLIRARLTSDELRYLLKAIQENEGQTYRGLIKLLDLEEKVQFDSDSFRRRMQGRASFDTEEIAAISERLHHRVDDKLWNVLRERHPEIVDRIFRPKIDLPNALVAWTGTAGNQGEFIDKNTGIRGNGEYLILRVSGEDAKPRQLICSYMLVTPPTPKSPISQFLTYRPKSNGHRRSVRGVIFEQAGLIYAIGKSRHYQGFRTSLLKRQTSGGATRHDLLGIRLGIQENPDRPFAYPIYCHQMKFRTDKRRIVGVLGRRKIEDADLNAIVPSLENIVEILVTAGSQNFGTSTSD